MSVREYVGARYVPLFADPLDWDSSKTYEPLTVVYYQGNSYTSRQYVPAGIDITNSTYWAQTGNYNAQIEQYRAEVQSFDDRISDNTDAIEDNTDAISAINSNNWVSTNRIADNAVTKQKLAAETAQFIDSESIKSKTFVFIGDSYGRGTGSTDGNGWPYYIATYLQLDSWINISNGGAGFIDTGHTGDLDGMRFYEQLDYAAGHLPSGKTANDVNFVVIGGGRNDNNDGDEQRQAAYNTVRHAKTIFPNAKVIFFPFASGDTSLKSQQFIASYMRQCNGCEMGGAEVHPNSLYWLYPYESTTSYGDNSHPNNEGYAMLGRMAASVIMGGDMGAYTDIYARSAEGYATATGATNVNFLTGVQNGIGWFGGEFRRNQYGELCTMPTYLRPNSTIQLMAYVYLDSTHQGIGRVALNAAGVLSWTGLIPKENYTADEGAYRIFIPMQMWPLGHVAF